MAKPNQPDSPLMQALYALLKLAVAQPEPLLHPEGERLWRETQEMVTAAGGVPHIPIEAAAIYCLNCRHSYAFDKGDFDEALTAIQDFWSHPQSGQNRDDTRYSLHRAAITLLELQRANEALEMVRQLLSEQFDNRRENLSALVSVYFVFMHFFLPDGVTAREGELPPGWGEVAARWTGRIKRSAAARYWINETPKNKRLWDVVQRVCQ